MSDLFERFVKLAKEEFGYTVKKSKTTGKADTFESLFGVSVQTVSDYELPYAFPITQLMYSDECLVVAQREIVSSENKFDVEENLNFAA